MYVFASIYEFHCPIIFSGQSRLNFWLRIKEKGKIVNLQLVSPTRAPLTSRAHPLLIHYPPPLPPTPLRGSLSQGCCKVLVSGTAEGITAHVKALFERGQETVKTLRAIIT